MSSYAPGTPIAEMQAMDERIYGKPKGGAQPAVNPFQPIGGISGGMGGGSATDGLGQVNQGSKTVGTALQRAQKANEASSEAIGGGKNPIAGTGENIFKTMNKGGKVKAYAKGGVVSNASSRGDGCAQRGKTKGRFV